MTKEELKYLVDLQLEIDELEEIIGPVKKFEDFNNNLTKRRAVERVFEIIGEAIGNYKKLNTENEITGAKEIIGLRNVIAHAYDAVDYPKLWSIIIKHIPKLKKEIDILVDKYDKHLGYK